MATEFDFEINPDLDEKYITNEINRDKFDSSPLGVGGLPDSRGEIPVDSKHIRSHHHRTGVEKL